MLGRWVAGIVVLAAIAISALSGGAPAQTDEFDWNAPAIQTVAR
jgi:hypothetical protein